MEKTKKGGALARKLRELIPDAATSAKLQEYLGVTSQAINQYKQGTAFPKAENLIKIAEFFDISLDYLIGRPDEDEKSIVSQRIENVRIKRGLTQPQFAEALGLPEGKGRSTVNNWEQGAIQVKSDALILISKTFGVSADYLLGLTDEETVSEDLRAAHKMTGLTVESILWLSAWSDKDNPYFNQQTVDIINDLISVYATRESENRAQMCQI